MSAAGIRSFNRTAALACAPFLGLLLWLAFTSDEIRLQIAEAAFPQSETVEPDPAAAAIAPMTGLDRAGETAKQTGSLIRRQIRLYRQTNADMAKIAAVAAAQSARPRQIYDRRVTAKLGKPAATITSDKLRAQLFHLKTQNFRSYALKIQLKDKDAMKLALAAEESGGAETTLAAVNRYNAVAGVNAGGFADKEGKRYPLSTTVADGEYVGGFQPTFKDLFFVGLNADSRLIGGNFSDRAQLDALEPRFGVSFVPVLMKNGRKTAIPDKWEKNPKRAPRTVIASFKDDQLLFIVADGYNESGSSGATLAEMQMLLQRFGAIDGYNLDGGGSSSLIFNGRVVNKPSDGRLRKLPTNFVFLK